VDTVIGWSGAEGWEGRPHPDDKHHAKMALCKKGIQKLWSELAPDCEHCYVWLDFGCINQDGSPCAELKQLDKIIQFCDCVFTPIVEDDDDIKKYHDKLHEGGETTKKLDADESAHEREDQQDAIAKHYHSKKWNGDEHAYLNRGWTRVEMFYASAIPFLTSGAGSGSGSGPEKTFEVSIKTSKFKAGLHSAVNHGRRPQFVYGTYQMKNHLPMRVLPPLLHSYFHRYNPMNGNLSVASDRSKITALVDELMPFLKFAVESYEGSLNSSKKKEGFGKCTYENGDVYEGEFVNDEKVGTGTYHYSDGCVYTGEWRGGKENGAGSFTYACGDVYTGGMLDGQFHGQGEIVSVRGRRLRGRFDHDKFIGGGGEGGGEGKGGGEVQALGVTGVPAASPSPSLSLSTLAPPRFERALSTGFFLRPDDEGAAAGFDCDLSCSSGGEEDGWRGGEEDFDARLSVASFGD
jgi:hypothetical protein